MTESVMRLLNMLVAYLLAQAERLARLAVARHEVTQYAAAYEEAKALEASGQPALAALLRAQIEASVGSAMNTDPQAPPALNGDGHHHPFALGPPRPPEPGPTVERPEGQGTRRRGRRPAAAKPPPQTPQAEPPAAPTTPAPVSSPDQHL